MQQHPIAPDFVHGKNLRLGHHIVIEEDVIVGDDVAIGHHVVLKSGTRVGSHVNMADYTCTTGASIIGDHVNIRTQAVISKSVIVEDCAYIGPGVMTNHTKHVTHMREHMPKAFRLTRIGYGSIVGSRVEILAGVSVVPNVIIGGTSLVTKDITRSGIYFGMPVRLYQELPEEYFLQGSSRPYAFPEEIIAKYLPYLKQAEASGRFQEGR